METTQIEEPLEFSEAMLPDKEEAFPVALFWSTDFIVIVAMQTLFVLLLMLRMCNCFGQFTRTFDKLLSLSLIINATRTFKAANTSF